MAEHRVWDNTNPASLTDFNAGQALTLSSAFYVSAAGWKLAGVRLYVPAGSPLIGKTVTFKGWQPAVVESSLGGAGMQQVSSGALVTGWNEKYFPAPMAVNDISSLQKFMVAYHSPTGDYLRDPGVTNSSIKALDGTNLFFSETNSGAGYTIPGRGGYRYADGGNGAAGTYWGLDVIMYDEATTGKKKRGVGKSLNLPGPISF